MDENYELAEDFLKKVKYNKALEYFTKSYNINKKLNNIKEVRNILRNIMDIYFIKSDIDNSLKWLKEATNFQKKYILKGRKKKVKTASKIKDNKLKQSLQELDKDINELAKDSFKKLIGDQYERLGELYIERGDFDKADEYFNKAKSLMKESSISNNSRVEWLCIINQYFIYSATSMFDEEAEKIDINKIITDLREMYRKRLDKNDIEDAALLSMYLSILLDATKDEGAIEFLKKAYDLYKQIDNKKNLGRVCLAFGLFYLNNNNLEDSIKYLNESNEIFNEIGNEYWKIVNMSHLGTAYLNNDELDKAYKYLNDSLSGSKRLNIIDITTQNLFNIMVVFVKEGKYRKALKFGNNLLNYLQTGNKIKKFPKLRKLLSSIYSTMAEIYSNLNDTYNSRLFLQKAINIQREIVRDLELKEMQNT
ncbi:MAG: tetratricopeptide repeat protein [Candidatus Helarchaeota archaeon]